MYLVDGSNCLSGLFKLNYSFITFIIFSSEQIDLACDVLTLCMNSLSLGESTSRYGTALERALYHPSANVKLMALKEVHRTASNSEAIAELSQQIPIILALVTCVGDSELSVAKYSSDILILVGKNHDGLRQLLIPEVKKAFADTIITSDIVRFRIYEVNIFVYVTSHTIFAVFLKIQSC